jgi:glyoxylase-like metal-dependent hydrolase (beta-lactamase superfamily II)
MTNPNVEAFFDRATFTVSYIVSDPESNACVIIDPVLDYDAKSGRTSHASADALINFIKVNNKNVEWILETHAHADHLSAAPYIRENAGGRIAIGEHIPDVQKIFAGIFNTEPEFATDGSQFDHLIADGEILEIGGLSLRAIHTPGHTPACMTYVIGDAAFVGDTLFMPDYGTARCDFPGGDPVILYQSIEKIFELPDTTRLFMCHDYKAPGRDEFKWETTVKAQKAGNIHINTTVTESDFVAMRSARDATLDMPKLILPSVQVNIRAGHFPPEESNGTVYLKIPINVL